MNWLGIQTSYKVLIAKYVLEEYVYFEIRKLIGGTVWATVFRSTSYSWQDMLYQDPYQENSLKDLFIKD